MNVFNLGLLLGNTPDYSPLPFRTAFQLGINDANKLLQSYNITLNFTSITISVEDNAEDGARAALVFLQRKAAFMFGGWGPQACASFLAVAGFSSIPTISSYGCLEPKFQTFPHFVSLRNSIPEYLLHLDYMRHIKFSSFQFIASSNFREVAASFPEFFLENNITVTAINYFSVEGPFDEKVSAVRAAKADGHRFILIIGSHEDIRDVFIALDQEGMNEDYIFWQNGMRLDVDVIDPTDTPERNAAIRRALRGSVGVQEYLQPNYAYSKFVKRLNASMCETSEGCLSTLSDKSFSVPITPAARYYDSVVAMAQSLIRVMNGSSADPSSFALAVFNSMLRTPFSGIAASYFSTGSAIYVPFELYNIQPDDSVVTIATYTVPTGAKYFPVKTIWPNGRTVLPPEFLLVTEELSEFFWNVRLNVALVYTAISIVVLGLLLLAVTSVVRAQQAKRQTRRINLARLEDLARAAGAERDVAETANQNKRKFLRYMMHELRVPFHVLDVGLQSLEEEMPLFSESVQTLLGQMSEASNMMSGLMDDALNLQRIEDGRFEVRMSTFSLSKMVDYVVHAHSIRVKTSGLRIAVRVSESAHGIFIKSDEVRLRQCLSNLVDNAIKFSPVGGLIEILCNVENGSRVVIGVKDEGPGIGSKDRTKLFEAWSQINAGVLQNGKGSGLGLSLVKTIMEMLNGHCRIEPCADGEKGAHFTLDLSTTVTTITPEPAGVIASLSVSVADNNGSYSSDVAGTPHALANLRILLADDDQLVRSVTTRLLKQKGADIETACNGAEALLAVEHAIAKGCPFDLVLIDNQMPIMDGHEACRRMPKTARVFGLTGDVMEEDTENFKQCGALEVLSKPLKMELLIAAIQRHEILPQIQTQTILESDYTVFQRDDERERGRSRPRSIHALPALPQAMTLPGGFEPLVPSGNTRTLAVDEGVESRRQHLEPLRMPHESQMTLPGSFEPLVPMSASSGTPTMIPPTPIRRMRILVVDDVSMVLSVMTRLLQHKGATVRTAMNGLEAVEAVEKAANEGLPFHLVLLDKEMPVMDGYEACEIISKKLPVFGVTANALPEDIAGFMSHGALVVFKKPLRLEMMFAEIEKHHIHGDDV